MKKRRGFDLIVREVYTLIKNSKTKLNYSQVCYDLRLERHVGGKAIKLLLDLDKIKEEREQRGKKRYIRYFTAN